MENYLPSSTAHNEFCRQGVFWFNWFKCNLFGDPLYLPMEGEEGFSPAVSIWGVVCSLICNIPAALSEGCQAQAPLLVVLKVSRGFPVTRRRVRWNREAGAAGPGYCKGRHQREECELRSLEHQQDTADGPVLLKLKMSGCSGKFTWQKTGIWGVKNTNMHIDKYI